MYMQQDLGRRWHIWAGLAVLAGLLTPALCRGQFSGQVSASSAFSIPQADLIQADALNAVLKKDGPGKPLVFQVGSRVMFDQAHIPGTQFVGPTSQSAALENLAAKVASANKKAFIVLYCGCCPWNRCPNIGQAYHRLRELGFVNVKALYLAHNFGEDWVDKGYRVEKGL
jgi:thiosulfate/3-mercaptopyruvate sulfurtransferase